MNFEVMETEHFLFHCYKSDCDIVSDIATMVEEKVLSVSLVFSVPPLGKKIDYYICPDVESFIQLSGVMRDSYESWMVGNTDWDNGRVCVISPRAVTDRSPADMYKVIVHEAVHVVMDSFCNPKDLPLWLTEGVAVLFADQTPETLDPEQAPLISRLSGSSFASLGGYKYSGAYVRHFLELYGADVLKKILTGEASADGYIAEGFEKEAAAAFMDRCK